MILRPVLETVACAVYSFFENRERYVSNRNEAVKKLCGTRF